MPLIFDSVFAAALARELGARWSGRRIEGVHFDREARSVTIDAGDETWIWLLHPREGVLVPLPGFAAGDSDDGHSRRREGRKRRDRGLLSGPRRITGVTSPPDTRQIILVLAGPEGREERLVFDLATNRWNALHVLGDEVRAVLNAGLGRDPAAPGDPWRPAVSDRQWADEDAPDLEAWTAVLRELSSPDSDSARRCIAWLSGSNEDAVLEDALTGSGVDPGVAAESLARYLRLRDAALRTPPEGWLLPGPEGDVRPYVASLDRDGAARVGSVLDLFATWARRSDRIGAALRAATETPETTALREALTERRERTARKIQALRAEVEESPREPEELRQLGHLLLARKADVPAGARDVRLESFSGELVTVQLDPALDAVGNAEAYYDRAKRQERAAEQLPARIAKVRRRITALDEALDRLATRGPDDSLWKLAGGKRNVLATDKDRSGQSERLPYRVYRTSSGREIRAGRSAKGNDELTFRHSAPEDIWMHVREAAGSHVVLRWGRKEQNPPEADIAEAALVAAVLSRARGSTVVPVAWTRRKYVRKPRKAPPGAVVPERTQTVFVEPDARRVSKMAETD